MSFQPASDIKKRGGGSDALGKLVPGRNGSDNESAVTNRRRLVAEMMLPSVGVSNRNENEQYLPIAESLFLIRKHQLK